jgi:hypothetical protein
MNMDEWWLRRIIVKALKGVMPESIIETLANSTYDTIVETPDGKRFLVQITRED